MRPPLPPSRYAPPTTTTPPTTLHTRSQAAHSPSGPRQLTSPLRIVAALRRAHRSSQVCLRLPRRHSTVRVPTAPSALKDSRAADAMPRFRCVALTARRVTDMAMSTAEVMDVAPTRSPTKPCFATCVHAGISRSHEEGYCAFLFVFAFCPTFYHLQQAPCWRKCSSQ